MGRLSLASTQAAKFNQTLSPDKGALSVIFDDPKCCNDAPDPLNQVETGSIDLQFAVRDNAAGAPLVCDVRGAFLLSDPQCWAHPVVRAKGRRLVVQASDQPDQFQGRLAIPVATRETLWISLLLVAQRNPAVTDSQSEVQLDSVDLAFG